MAGKEEKEDSSERQWEGSGVCILSAVEDYDAGDEWAYRTFPMRRARKASLYRREATEGAVEALWELWRR